jgi:hypothetical protein
MAIQNLLDWAAESLSKFKGSLRRIFLTAVGCPIMIPEFD